MNEKVYNTVSHAGSSSLVLGILVLVTGGGVRNFDDYQRGETAEEKIRDYHMTE